MKPLDPNTTLQDRYKITEIIGKGGMGEVYLAIDQRLGHSIALKRTTVGDDKLLTEAFEREARTLAQLRHSILPKVSDHFIENDEQYLIMEYISGDDLSERLKVTNKAFPLNWVMFWADQILDALTYLHNYDPPIIHRDIKPQNLKLTSENHIVLLDFGLSKNSLGKTQVTNSGSVLGYTPHYASMEQIRGTGTNARSDIFSLSATLYQLISNQVPPDALTRADAMLSDLPDPLKPLTELNPEINEIISANILKGMEITQEKRFETARDMQKALRRSYNEMQKSMSAQTIAFDSHDVDVENIENTDIGDKTEVMTDLPLQTKEISEAPNSFEGELTENDKNLAPTLVGGYRPDDVSSEKTEVINAADFNAAVGDRDLSATVEFNAQERSESVNKTDEDTPAMIPSEVDQNLTQDIPIAESEFRTQEEVLPDNFKTEYNLKESLEPKVTAQNVSLSDNLSENIVDTNWDESFVPEKANPNETKPNNAEADAVGVGLTDNFSNVDVEESLEDSQVITDSKTEAINPVSVQQTNATDAAAPPPNEKSSIGKYIAILGGLGVVLFLMIGSVLALGYFYTNGTFSLGNDGAVTTESETETKPETVQPETESIPEVVDSENAESTDSTNDSENVDTNTSETAGSETTDDGSDNAETTSATTSNEPKIAKPSTKNTTVTTKSRNQTTTAKRAVTKPRTTIKKTNKPPVKKTTKPPVKKTTTKKKDAGVL